MTETFGPEYVRPTQEDCPNCPCCTKALCERGSATIRECQGHTAEDAQRLVAGCPCSSEETRGTAAWRAGRIRVVGHALSPQALGDDVVAALRAVAAGEDVTEYAEQVHQLSLRRYVGLLDGSPALTELGDLYLRTLEEPRKACAVRVVDVDVKRRTARVIASGWSLDEPVTVLLDQLLAATQLTAAELPGRPLEAVINYLTEWADDVVLTDIRVIAPPPDFGNGLVEEGHVDGAPELQALAVEASAIAGGA
ncbi:hypothetical protein [Kitasatospora aureofaciens]|uniref:hypothetical protein n=1 Tax=Kitasatospora aureofaciens TaxID=1894 RepID=UPI0033FF916F